MSRGNFIMWKGLPLYSAPEGNDESERGKVPSAMGGMIVAITDRPQGLSRGMNTITYKEMPSCVDTRDV